jgi:2-furoyl-CoA dehydrogenase large subunit
VYADGGESKGDYKALPWADLVNIAHRNFHLLPEGMEPSLEATYVMQVPTGDELPKAGRMQIYSFIFRRGKSKPSS